MLNSRRVRSLLALLVVALVAAACGSTDRETSPSQPGGDGPGAARTASEVGVTNDAITIGILSGDIKKLVQIGFASDIGDVRSLYETFLIGINAKGGVNGRRINWSYHEFDFVGGEPAMRQACDELFDGPPIFAAITSDGFNDAIPCLTVEHDTPVLASEALSQSIFDTSKGNLFTLPPVTQVSAAAMVELLGKQGALEGKTLGVVYGDRPGMSEVVEQGLEPALAKLGKSLTVKAQITGQSAEPARMAQIQPTIDKLKAAKVDGLFVFQDPFLAANLLNVASSSNYHPQLFGSDYQRIADELVLPFIDTYQAEKAFNGMLGTSYTRVGDDTVGAQPDPADAACLTKYSDANGIDVPKYGTQRWAALVRICHQIDVFVKGLEAAGPNPTHGSFRDALANRGKFHVGFATNGSFAPNKHDAADEFRIVRYDGATNRFSPVTEFTPAGR